ncbi:DUF5117 domain-containing protein [Seonamhaeicola sediminis]|uniref:DUF5117 domain-containing protein n=2 Tax=Seonamhaeicola sediminis TaxID=2528206 RepID=A0A562YES4_9FLAO|nr:DUF5117 domain-containing protein [Seonamhaeicola sediminis]
MAFLMPQNIEAQKKKNKKKKDEVTAVAAKPKAPKEKTIADLVKKSKKIEGLFTIYQDTVNGSLQMLISKDQIGKEFIYFSQIANGVLDAGRIIKGQYKEEKIFKIEKYFNKIEFIAQNTSFYYDPNNPVSKSANTNVSNGVLASIKIEAMDDNKELYLIKADDLFLQETFSRIKQPSTPGTSPMSFKLGVLDKNKTKINSIKNYPKNTNLKVEYVYSNPSTLNGGSNALADGRNVSIKVFHSLIAMPENDYEPRFDDPRVGFFITEIDNKTSTSVTPYRDLIQRWYLKKKNPEADISEPVEPIVWWMENTTPHEWRETIKDAVLQWNKAFEKAGFKNAIVVKQQPDDADWDAGDIRYNVLRWTSSPQPPFGGYGPSFVNPRTGQILGADVMLEYSTFSNMVFIDKVFGMSSLSNDLVEKNHNNDHLECNYTESLQENVIFAKIVASAFGGSYLELNQIEKEVITGLVMHEIGHTLGLYHNFKASQLFSPQQLSNPDFIAGKCLTASVMDYTLLNVTRDRSKQGQYDDMSVGPYDIWAIQFGYTPFKTDTEREALLNRSTEPELIFGNDADDMRSPGKAIDPRVNTWDQSNDAIQYSIDRIEIASDLMKTSKDNFITEGKSYQELRNVYFVLNTQKALGLNIISRYIGGVYVDRAMAGQKAATQPYTPVSLDDQKRAMKALKDYAFAPKAFDAPNNLYNYLARQRRGSNLASAPEDPKIHNLVLRAQKSVLDHILHPNTLQRITDSELYGNKYTLPQFMSDLNTAIFSADIYGNVNTFRQNLQLEYTNRLIDMLTGKQKDRFSYNSKSMALYNLKRIRTMAAPSGNTASKAHKQHLRTLIDNALTEIK